MCLNCIREKYEQHQEALVQAMEHLDAAGCAEDSLVRGLVDVRLACNLDPDLHTMMMGMYPTPYGLMQ